MANTPSLQGKRVAAVVADGFEQVELTEPKKALEEAGARVDVVSLNPGHVKGWQHDHWGDPVKVDVPIQQAQAQQYDALLLPGGVMSPDKLRRDPRVLRFVTDFFEQGKPVAAICHGPWTLIDAGVARGRHLTSYHSLQSDLKNAGAFWVDQPVVTDRGLVTSRQPSDIPAFNQKMLEEIAEGIHASQREAVHG